jgi:hypothetical protein
MFKQTHEYLETPTARPDFGVARYSTEQEKQNVDEGLSRLKKAKSISVNGKLYRLAFKYKDNFGEPLWRIRVSESK